MPIVLEHINLTLGNKPILQDFSCTFPQQGVVCLCGPSGCGKTTLLHMLAGLHMPQSGSIQGMEGQTLSMVFQEERLLPWLNAVQNVAIALPKEEEALALPYLAALELAEQAHKLPCELSGGMRRRVSIARALAYGGDILLLDEPTNGLDSELAERVMLCIKQQYAGKLVLLVTHDKDFAVAHADVLLELSGPPLAVTAVS